MLNKSILGAAMIAGVLALSACGGSTTTVKQTETQGQQLMDLKEAYDNGVITEETYQRSLDSVNRENLKQKEEAETPPINTETTS